MNQFEQALNGFIIPPQAIVHSASATVLNSGQQLGTYIDTQSADAMLVRIYVGAASGVATACKLQECATSGGSYTDITGTVFGATGMPSLSAVVANTVFEFYITYRNGNRLRYVAPVVTIDGTSSGDYITATYEIYLGNAPLPYNDATRGVTAHVIVQ